MAVVVKRGLGDKPGPDIVDPLLSSEASLIERGRQEINANDSDRVEESGSMIGADFLRPGAIAQSSSAEGSFKAYVDSFSFSVQTDSFSVTSFVKMERIK